MHCTQSSCQEEALVDGFIWIFNVPNIKDEEEFIDFMERTINAKLPDYETKPGILKLVKSYQIHCHYRTCWKYKKCEC